MTERDRTRRLLEDAVIVAVVRTRALADTEAIVDALLEGGIEALEITSPTPGAHALIAKLKGSSAYDRVAFGMGTIMDATDATRAVDAGASFLVSPHFDPALITKTLALDAVSIPGALTPTEIVSARRAGADFVKIFPITSAGGPNYLRLLSGPLPDLPLWVSGSVAIEEIGAYLEVGAKLIGLTTALLGANAAETQAKVRRAKAEVATIRRSR